MPNVSNPQNFVITPGKVVPGAPVDSYDITFAAAPQDAQGNNVVPAGFPGNGAKVSVPAKDLAPQPDGTILVPLPDIITSALKAGTYIAVADADSSAAVNQGGVATESGFSNPPTFFDITAPVPNAPALSVA